MFFFYDLCISKNTQNFSPSSKEGTATSEFDGVFYGYVLKFPTKYLINFASDIFKYISGH